VGKRRERDDDVRRHKGQGKAPGPQGSVCRRAQRERAQREWTVTRSANASTGVRLTKSCGAPACKRGREREGLHPTTCRPESGGTSMGASSTGISAIDPAAGTVGKPTQEEGPGTVRECQCRVQRGIQCGRQRRMQYGKESRRKRRVQRWRQCRVQCRSEVRTQRPRQRWHHHRCQSGSQRRVNRRIERRRDGRMERRPRCQTDLGTVSVGASVGDSIASD
jgi:hypothetical protein